MVPGLGALSKVPRVPSLVSYIQTMTLYIVTSLGAEFSQGSANGLEYYPDVGIPRAKLVKGAGMDSGSANRSMEVARFDEYLETGVISWIDVMLRFSMYIQEECEFHELIWPAVLLAETRASTVKVRVEASTPSRKKWKEG